MILRMYSGSHRALMTIRQLFTEIHTQCLCYTMCRDGHASSQAVGVLPGTNLLLKHFVSVAYNRRHNDHEEGSRPAVASKSD